MTDAERTIDTPDDPAPADPDTPGTKPTAQDGGAAEPAPAATDGAREAVPEEAPVRRTRRIGVLAYVSLTALVLDLVTKIVAVELLEHRAPVELLGEWLRLELVRNSGAAFGMGQTLTLALTAIAAIVVVVILRLARKLYSAPWAVALGLLLGGALGNLTDRIFRAPAVFEGAVVDFVSPKHFAVFNVADSAIVCGGILIVILSFRGLDPDGTVHRDEPTSEEPDASAPAAAEERADTAAAPDGTEAERAGTAAEAAAAEPERSATSGERAADPVERGTDAGDRPTDEADDADAPERGTGPARTDTDPGDQRS